MGCFGYICKGCGTPINGSCFTGGEKCLLIHVRHGQELGRVEGHYDEYGRVIEQEGLSEDRKYRGDSSGINSHNEICKSEFHMEDSLLRLDGVRVYNGKEVTYTEFIHMKMEQPIGGELFTLLDKSQKSRIITALETSRVTAEQLTRQYIREKLENSDKAEKLYAALPKPVRKIYSGTVAWHNLCYRKASHESRADLTPSDLDPNQSWGRIRKKYC